ncbi:MAG TPA: hypothetical protein VKT28_03280 [Puia sp.]|nr:hypothetical protein [Puia sp.]
MAKAKKAKAPKLPKKLNLPNDEPLRLDMSFEEAVKLALNTPIKKKK